MFPTSSSESCIKTTATTKTRSGETTPLVTFTRATVRHINQVNGQQKARDDYTIGATVKIERDGTGRDVVNGEDKTAGTATHYSWVEIPWFPASMPKLLSRHVYSALLVLDVSAPSEPGGLWWVLDKTG